MIKTKKYKLLKHQDQIKNNHKIIGKNVIDQMEIKFRI